MRHKYNASKVMVDGHTFDSQLEAQRYWELKMMERAGEIENLELQPSFELMPSFRKNGVTYRKITYIADFRYIDKRTGETIIEDTKGFKTKEYILKKKIFEYLNPDLTIKEITK